MSDAAERVEEYLRQFTRQTSVDIKAVHTVFTDPNADPATLTVADLSLLVECAQWLLMASVGDVHREYASAIDDEEPIEEKTLRPEPLDHVADCVESWNRKKHARDASNDRAEKHGRAVRPDIMGAFVAQRLVTDWERRA